MTDIGVDFHLDIVRQDRVLSVSAYVAAEPSRTLTWRLVASSRTPGGTSEIVQSGVTDGRRSEPVGTIAMSPDSQGCVILTIMENAREVGREMRDLSAPEGDTNKQCR